MPRHTLIKLTKTKHKERILKAAREKQQVTYKGNPIHLTADVSTETLQAKKEWQDIVKVLKGRNQQLRLLYPAWTSFKIDGEMKKLFRQAKVKRIQYRQTSFTKNVIGAYTVKKYKRRKRIAKSTPNNLKSDNGINISIITLNVNELNALTKRQTG